MKLLRPRKWSDEHERLFLQHAGNIHDNELDEMLKVGTKWIRQIRRSLGIPAYCAKKYTKEHKAWIEKHYKTMWFEELMEAFAKQFPDIDVKAGGLDHFMGQHRLIKTRDEINARMRADADAGICKERMRPFFMNPKFRKPGAIFYSNFYKQWLIKTGPGQYKFLKAHVWEQTNGPTPKGYYVEIIDKEKEITIENLKLTKRGTGNFLDGKTILTDAWVLGTMVAKKAEPEMLREIYTQNPIFIQEQRNKILLGRLLKEMKDAIKRTEDHPQKDD